MSWGEPGKGKWVTIYANDGHVFLEVAGIRFDTSAAARHRLALDQRDALHGGLRGAASGRPLAPFGPWGVHPMVTPFGVGRSTGVQALQTRWRTRLMPRFAHAHDPLLGPPAHVLAEVDAAWERAQDLFAGELELHFTSAR